MEEITLVKLSDSCPDCLALLLAGEVRFNGTYSIHCITGCITTLESAKATENKAFFQSSKAALKIY